MARLLTDTALAAGGDAAEEAPSRQRAERPSPPPRALGISVLSLLAAGTIGILWPESVHQYAGFVWILALIPLFLLSYYRGWQGAAVAALTAMVALVAVEVLVIQLMGRQVDWWLLGGVTVVLILVTLGAGSLSEMLHRQRSMALQMAYEDSLTELANRRLLQEHAEKAIATAERTGDKVGMVFLDLIRFKKINDRLGHRAGDDTLVGVADRLRRSVRGADTIARVGGDEFAVLLSESVELEDAVGVARRIREEMSVPVQVAGQSVQVNARLGVALYPDHASDFDELLSKADPGKQPAGAGGPDGIAVYDPDESPGFAADDPILGEDLRQAVDEGEGLLLHYQPVIDFEERRAVGAEAFLRWRHPELGMLTAGDFLTVAESTGLVRDIEQRTLASVVLQAREWAADDGPGWVSVNLSPISFEDPDLVGEVDRLLREAELEPGRLVLELTDRVTLRNPETVVAVLDELRDLGVRLAIDDFGTGQSSLEYLERFSADFLKVDMVFVTRLGQDRKQERLVEGILGMARGLGLEVIAEGVETKAQYDWLRSSRCDYYQGYFAARPAEAGDLEMEPAGSDGAG